PGPGCVWRAPAARSPCRPGPRAGPWARPGRAGEPAATRRLLAVVHLKRVVGLGYVLLQGRFRARGAEPAVIFPGLLLPLGLDPGADRRPDVLGGVPERVHEVAGVGPETRNQAAD